ncbi:MAG: hypothetical protein ABI625_10395 [bacterium]
MEQQPTTISSAPSTSTGVSSSRQTWEVPALTKLPPLTELTLQTGGGIPGGGGTGGGGGTVF